MGLRRAKQWFTVNGSGGVMFRSIEVEMRSDAGDDSSDGFETLQSNGSDQWFYEQNISRYKLKTCDES